MVSTKTLASALLAAAAASSQHRYALADFPPPALVLDEFLAFYQHGGYGGQSLSGYFRTDQCYSMPCFDKKTSSFQHAFTDTRKSVKLMLYASADCSHSPLIDFFLPNGTGGRDSLGKDANDMISSFRLYSYPSPDTPPISACNSNGYMQCGPPPPTRPPSGRPPTVTWVEDN